MVWDPLSKPVDYVTFAGVRSPGLAEVTGLDDVRKIDVVNAYGVTGAALRFLGREPAKFTVKLKLYDEQHWAAWSVFKGKIERLPNRGVVGKKSAMDFWHPYTEMLGIKHVVVEAISQPEQTDNGEYTITIKLIEHRSPKLTLAKVEGAVATQADPIDDVIKALKNNLQELAAE